MLRNVQPMTCECDLGTVALAHNGDLINAQAVREELIAEGVDFETTNDSEVIIKLIAKSCARTIEDAVVYAMSRIKGAYSVVVMTNDKLVGFRDPHGVRPLCVGKLNGDHHVIASETCALNTIGAELYPRGRAG